MGKMADYKNASLPVGRRVEDLLDRMTIEEKVAQLGSVKSDNLLTRGRFSPRKAKPFLKNGTGQATRIGGAPGIRMRQAAQIIRDLQDFLLNSTRLGIPAIVHEECLSGLMANGATSFPQAIGLASTWNPELIESMTSVIRRQTRGIGATQVFAPVLDVARDPRWGRTEETLGEDPYLVARMGTAYVRGLQGDDPQNGLLSCPKHFAAHGIPEGGRNTAPVRVGPREFREVYLFPFEAAVKEGRARSVMNAYHELDGIPCAGDRSLLTGILREEWGFDGFVPSDYGSINMLASFHKVAADKKEAAVMALEAGIDVELPESNCYGEPLLKALREGAIAQTTIDQAVRRVLRAKFELGLFDRQRSSAAGRSTFVMPSDRTLARRVAGESIVLLKNEGTLPLKKDLKSIAVVGPSADRIRYLFGDYAYTAHVSEDNDLPMTTVLQGIRRAVSKGTAVHYAQGCDLTGQDRRGFRKALDAAKKSDVVVAAVGESSGFFGPWTISGEGRDRAELTLPRVQEELVQALCETGKPVVLVLLNGRPLSIRRLAERCGAVIEAWFPGAEGGSAVADVLFGDVNPGGKLPISVPAAVGHIPVHYSRKPSGFRFYMDTDNEPPTEMPSQPLFPFGHGLSYTRFRYSGLRISPAKSGPVGKVAIRCRVTNTGKRAGDEVVQLYISDEVASVSRPVKELRGFQRISLNPGQAKTVAFRLALDQLAFYDRDMRLVVEPGTFRVMIGSSSEDIRLTGAFEVTGTTKVVPSRRTFFCETEVG